MTAVFYSFFSPRTRIKNILLYYQLNVQASLIFAKEQPDDRRCVKHFDFILAAGEETGGRTVEKRRKLYFDRFGKVLPAVKVDGRTHKCRAYQARNRKA
ncbi:hypothetical protein T4E_12233 [Trichinella pseudospiralis]|uniref:Uncharacterized protein n=1 Tax=Trichinella pseudospiralis TaxID=6337 RepID=A0A0V0XL87_TRIPS|nr:hypothetical protein T4E_12233 [Trichinella pseudospiralis]